MQQLKALSVVIFLLLGANVNAYQTYEVKVIIVSNVNTLTIYIPGNGTTVSIAGLGLESLTNGEKDIHYLDEYSAFAGLTLDALQTPICLRWVREGTNNTLFSDCASAPVIHQHTLSSVDVFWYDLINNQRLSLEIFSSTTRITSCGNVRLICEFTYIPPVNPSNTPLLNTPIPPTLIPPSPIPPTSIPPTLIPPTLIPPSPISPTLIPPSPIPKSAPIVSQCFPQPTGNNYAEVLKNTYAYNQPGGEAIEATSVDFIGIGENVTILEGTPRLYAGQEWYRIRTFDGADGWVLIFDICFR